MLKSMGGDAAEGSGREGEAMTAIKNAWLERAELGLDEEDWNAPLVRQMCRVTRCEGRAKNAQGVEAQTRDPGDLYAHIYEDDTVAFHAARGLYEFCMQGEGLPTCKAPSLSDFAIENYEFSNCLKSQPQCIRDRDVCTGTCGGSETGLLMLQDVVTTIVKEEIHGLAQERLDNGRVNATVLKGTINVPLFDLSPAFRLFSARVRVRGGFTGAPPPAQGGCLSRLLLTAPSACAAQPSTPRIAQTIHLRAPWSRKCWSVHLRSFLSSVKDSATGTRPRCRRRRRRRRRRSSSTASPSCRRRCRRRRRRRRLGGRAASRVCP